MASSTKTAPSGAKAVSTDKKPTTLLGRLAAITAPPARYNKGAQDQPKTRGLFVGLTAYFVGSYALQLLLLFIDAKLNLHLQSRVLFTLPLLGNVYPIMLIFFPLALALLWALYHFKVLPSPKEMALQRNQAAATSKGGATGSSRTAAKSSATTSKAVTGKTTTAGRATTGKVTTVSKSTAGKVQTTPKSSVTYEDDDIHQQVRAQMHSQARKKRK